MLCFTFELICLNFAAFLLHLYMLYLGTQCLTFLFCGMFIADYAVYAFQIFKGRTVTYSCLYSCHLDSCGDLYNWQSFSLL